MGSSTDKVVQTIINLNDTQIGVLKLAATRSQEQTKREVDPKVDCRESIALAQGSDVEYPR